jgi:hypothetical protein
MNEKDPNIYFEYHVQPEKDAAEYVSKYLIKAAKEIDDSIDELEANAPNRLDPIEKQIGYLVTVSEQKGRRGLMHEIIIEFENYKFNPEIVIEKLNYIYETNDQTEIETPKPINLT